MSGLLLRRAFVYRNGHWADDDYDFYDGERIVGRIFRADAGHPKERPWMWTIVFHERRPPGPHQGFAVPGGCDGGVQGELGARSIMNEQREHGPPSTSGRVPRHSVFLSERKTSVSLEEPFWQALSEIATERGITISALIRSLDAERKQGNLSSALRVFVLKHFRAICREGSGT